MANHLGKFSACLAEITRPLRDLLSKNVDWQWGTAQSETFSAIKQELCMPTLLAHYDPNAATKLSADASSYGLGAVLLQEQGSEWKPVAYASHSMSKTEEHYAQCKRRL